MTFDVQEPCFEESPAHERWDFDDKLGEAATKGRGNHVFLESLTQKLTDRNEEMDEALFLEPT